MVVAVVAGVVWFVLRPGAEPIPAGQARDLAARVTPMIEQKLTAEWLGGAAGQRVACAVRPFGVEPREGEAETAYVWTLCATLGTEVRSESSVPMAVHLDTGSIEAPSEGGYGEQIERIFPERLHDEATGTELVAGLDAVLEQRILSLDRP
ncbi:hypothetical protein AB0M02_23715 [Actinoplanes sp. NPDC051861]|uniref:hypothetical protein n=1 Tax=Actinoplanes sp. NPDC051861 TaxID=3155170 RepID=UPI00343A4601